MTQSESIHRGSAFVWLAASTALLLLLPLIAMQVSDQVSWGLLDFGVMAILVFVAGSSGDASKFDPYHAIKNSELR